MGWPEGIRALSLRSKVLLTLAVTATVTIAVGTYVSLGYWESETVRVSEQQALLASQSVRNSVESAMRSGSEGALRRSLLDLRQGGAKLSVRIFTPQGTIAYSSDPSEEGERRARIWVPDSEAFARDGVAHVDRESGDVHVLLPLSVAPGGLLEVTFSAAAIREGTRRGIVLALGLALGSVFAIAAILEAMLEREVLSPLSTIGRSLAERTGRDRAEGDEVRELRESVHELLRQEKRAADQAQARENMAELGQMAAEMAHEFKRPLAAIRAALDMLDQEYHLDTGGRAVMASVNEQIAHLTGTMQDLFSLAQPQELVGAPVELRDVLEDALVEFAGQPGVERVEVVRDYRADAKVYGDPRRLRQAVVNLMMNALEGMPDGGTLTLTLDREGAEGWISVTDTGVGMAPEAVERIFRPFHTTKPSGTGLGLPLVARIVSSHGGRVEVTSRPQEGSTFTIRLPVREEAPVVGAP